MCAVVESVFEWCWLKSAYLPIYLSILLSEEEEWRVLNGIVYEGVGEVLIEGQ